MAKTLPYMRWYVSDAESDEKYASLNDQELGFFHRCMNKSWVNGGIPADMGQLASLMKVSPTYLKKVWIGVGRCWYQNGDRFFNRRQEEERTRAVSKSEQATDAVRSRYGRRTDETPRARARAESESVFESSSDLPSEEKSTSRARRNGVSAEGAPVVLPEWKLDKSFSPFVVAYQKTGAALIDDDFQMAHGICWRKLDPDQKAARTASILERLECDYYSDPKYVPKPLKYIQTEWNRPIIKTKAKGTDYSESIQYPKL